MRRRDCLVAPACLSWLAGCGEPSQKIAITAILGGVAVDPAGKVVPNSVILVAGSRLQSVGSDTDVIVPPGSMSWSANDRFVVPAPVELPPDMTIVRLASPSDVMKASIKAPEVLEGTVSDAGELPEELVRSLATSGTIVVPRLARLAQTPARLARGLANVKRFIASGIRLASFGDKDSLAEWRLLAQAGLTPRQVLESATVHAAIVVRQRDTAGALRPGFLANLWVLRLDPLANTDHLASVDAIMREGVWQRSAGAAN